MNMIYIALALVPLLVFVLMFVLVARTVQRVGAVHSEHAPRKEEIR